MLAQNPLPMKSMAEEEPDLMSQLKTGESSIGKIVVGVLNVPMYILAAIHILPWIVPFGFSVGFAG